MPRQAVHLRLLFVAALTLLPLQAEWKRYVLANVAESSDTPTPQPLSYVTRNAISRGPFDMADNCGGCEPEEKIKLAEDGRAEVTSLGKIRGFEILTVRYSCSCTQAGLPFVPALSVIVKTGADEFREIFYTRHFDPWASLTSPEIVSASEAQTLLTAFVDEGGNRHQLRSTISNSTRTDQPVSIWIPSGRPSSRFFPAVALRQPRHKSTAPPLAR
jgi:hypothetical protein